MRWLIYFRSTSKATVFAVSLCYNGDEVRELEKTVFGDLLFFVNFCMDFQCLFLAAKILHRPFSVWRAALASAFGAAYAVAALFLSTSGALAFLLDFAVCFLMCLLGFPPKRRGMGRVFAIFLVYFGVSFAVGGAMSGMASLLSHLSLPISEGEDVSSGLFFLLAAVGGLSTFLFGRVSARRARETHATLRLSFDGVTADFFAMVDTGNLLVDPVSARPVVLLTVRAAKRLFSSPVLGLLTSGDPSSLMTAPKETARRIRVCPTAGATGEGLLLAIAPDGATVLVGKREERVSVLVAPVSLHTGFDGAEALLPATLISR